jgi:hypothetical protein
VTHSPDPREVVERLAACESPWLIGVRHHSPVLAAAVPALLDAFRPDVLLIELPMEFAEWLPWLGHPDAEAPLALAGSARSGDGPVAFYPFADFSPELAAIRWARRNDVRVEPCDLPLADRAWSAARTAAPSPVDSASVVDAVRRRLTGQSDGDLWDRLVEVGAAGSAAEAVRRAALAVGWLIRHDDAAPNPADLAREAWMRSRIAAAEGRVAVMIGAYHAPALLEGAEALPRW